MSLEIRNNLVARAQVQPQALKLQEDGVPEPPVDTETPIPTEPADPGTKAGNISNDVLVANLLGRPVALTRVDNSASTKDGDMKQGETTVSNKVAVIYETADEARANYKDIPDETFDKFFEIYQNAGHYSVKPKEPYTSCQRTEKKVFTATGFDLDENGKPCNFRPIYGTQITYTLKDTQGGGSVNITVGANVGPSNGSIQYLDSNGREIDSDGSINRSAIDCSVIEGYGVGLNNAETLHERGKGWSGSKEKMEEKATEMLNGNKFKSQIEAQYKTLVSSTGGTYDEKAFETFYQKAINQTLQTDGMITGRGARGLSKKGHAYCNVYNLVSTFLKNFDDMTKVKK